MRTLLGLSGLALLGFFWLTFGRATPEDLPKLSAEIRERFPEVEHLSVEELERRLQRARESGGEVPILLDVRTPEEFAVSHLPGAVRAESEEEALEVLAGVDRDRPVVVYCAVGYRSAELARELEEAGFTAVENLEGSIFAWANSGRPVVRDGEEVETVHPYDRRWGRFLRRELHAGG